MLFEVHKWIIFVITFFLLSTGLAVKARAQTSELKTISEILFTSQDYTYTTYDWALYKKMSLNTKINEKFKKLNLSDQDEFVLSRLLLLEAEQLDVGYSNEQFVRVWSHIKDERDFVSDRLKIELQSELKIQTFIDIKEQQLQDPAIFKTWVQILKRKFYFSFKSNSFKNELKQLL